MKLGTKTRYAVMAMADLCHEQSKSQSNTRGVPLSSIADRSGLSLSYLEQLFNKLKKKGLVESLRGSQGGYRLTAKPSAINVYDIIVSVDAPVQMVRCQEGGGCHPNGSQCYTHDLWSNLSILIQDYLISVSLEDIVLKRVKSPFARGDNR